MKKADRSNPLSNWQSPWKVLSSTTLWLLAFPVKGAFIPCKLQGTITFVKVETTNGTHHLQIGDADVEGLVDVGMPHQPNICDVKCPQVTL